MRYLRLIGMFIGSSFQQELAYRANFGIAFLHSTINLGVGVLSMSVLYSQIETLQGWTYPQALSLLAVYLIVSALRGLFIEPGMDALAGLGQDMMSGSFDFTLLRPISAQFMVTFRRWRLFSLFDLLLGLGVLVGAIQAGGGQTSASSLLAFFAALLAAVLVVYSILLVFTAMVFWYPGFMFTWVFEALFQLARYPVVIYPAWLRFILTWIIPVGMITTIPAQALSGLTSPLTLAASASVAVGLLAFASLLFRSGLRRYSSASS